MQKDSAIVIFCTVTLLAVIFWKASSRMSKVIIPAEDVEPVQVSGPGMIRARQFAAQPYQFMPPVIPYVENRGTLNGA